LLIVIVAIVGIYGLFYAAVTTVLMPMDTNIYKDQLNTIPELSTINESTITELESGAAVTESMSALAYTSSEERTQMANIMRMGSNLPPEFVNQNFEEYDRTNENKIWAYDLILRGDISNQLKNISSTYKEIKHLNNETLSLNQKAANDFESGDSKAYAEDLRNTANNLRQYNKTMEKLKTQLQNLINQLQQ